jgi:hypothetical protein
MEAVTGISIFARVFSAILPTVTGWFYTEKRINSQIDIQAQASGECFTAYAHARKASCYLSVTNLTPFPLVIDRMEIKAMFEGGSAILHQIIPHKLGTPGKIQIYTDGVFDISPEGLELAKRSEKSGKLRLDVRCYITSKTRSLVINRHIDQISNFHVHK